MSLWPHVLLLLERDDLRNEALSVQCEAADPSPALQRLPLNIFHHPSDAAFPVAVVVVVVVVVYKYCCSSLHFLDFFDISFSFFFVSI